MKTILYIYTLAATTQPAVQLRFTTDVHKKKKKKRMKMIRLPNNL